MRPALPGVGSTGGAVRGKKEELDELHQTGNPLCEQGPVHAASFDTQEAHGHVHALGLNSSTARHGRMRVPMSVACVWHMY